MPCDIIDMRGTSWYFIFLTESSKSPASIAQSNKQWVGTCLYQEWYKPLLLWSDFCQEVNFKTTNFFFPHWQSSHFCLTASGKSPDLTVPGSWPLCYSWIGYQQANGPPWALRSENVDHGFTCAHRSDADNPNLEVITAPSWCWQIVTLLLAEILHFAADFCLITFPS